MTERQKFRVTVCDEQGIVLDIFETELEPEGEPGPHTARAAVLTVAEDIRMGVA